MYCDIKVKSYQHRFLQYKRKIPKSYQEFFNNLRNFKEELKSLPIFKFRMYNLQTISF